jgi:uncharacterized protein
MVLRGQFLERPALIACGDLTLEGLYHRGERAPALLVCPSPSGGMDAPVAAELAWAAARAGHPSLRFQHRGVGASQGERDAACAVDDARAALAHLVDTAGLPAAVAGVGAGCDTALALAGREPVSAVVLVAPERAPAAAPPPRVAVLALLSERGASVDAAALAAALGPAGRVEIVPDSDALFRAGLAEVGARAVAFVARRG